MPSNTHSFESLLAQSLVGVAVIEPPEHTFTFANDAYRRLVGNVDVVGKKLLTVFPEIEGQGFVELLDRVLYQAIPFVGQEVPVRFAHFPAGETLYVNLNYHPRRNAKGTVDGILVTAFDVTEQVTVRRSIENQRNELRLNQQRLQQTLEATGAGTWEFDVETERFVMNPAFASMMGLSEPATLRDFLTKIHPADLASAGAAIGDTLTMEGGQRNVIEYRTVTKEGSVRWVSSRVKAFGDEEGHTTHIIGTAVDITERKNADAARDALLASIAAQDVFGVAVLSGEELRFELVNDAMMRIIGRRELQGRAILESIPELAGQGVAEAMEEVRRTGVAQVGIEVGYRLDPDGKGQLEDRHFNYIWQPVVSASGLVDGVLIIGHDVTDSVRARQREERHAAEVEARAAFEQQLIGIVSHDLRNPLSSIQLGAAALIRTNHLDERSMKSLARIQTSAERSGRMVRDLLDFTQARFGRGITLKPSTMDMHQAALDWSEELRSAFPSREIRVRCDDRLEGVWDGDRLAQVVHNLVSNAVKYSPEHTHVTLKLEGDDGHVSLSVHNLGPPIPAEAQQRLFQPFERGTVEADHASRSVGLGLFIVQHIVKAHGGTVTVDSTPDGGTTFRVVLPRRAQVAA